MGKIGKIEPEPLIIPLEDVPDTAPGVELPMSRPVPAETPARTAEEVSA